MAADRSSHWEQDDATGHVEVPDGNALDALHALRRLMLAQACIEARRAREVLFPEGLFGEPAWDMLLELFIARQQDRPVSVSDACLASRAPQTTALRWIEQLEAHGLVERMTDVTDRRRKFIRISDSGQERIVTWLDGASASS